ncbi:hypothetical protein [Kitasatospora purpeofusca]|uniref:hypothetical protein n=1 Tax=Kitasatospora purpeofusca TaxID=67352 RepID=UPI0037F253DC
MAAILNTLNQRTRRRGLAVVLSVGLWAVLLALTMYGASPRIWVAGILWPILTMFILELLPPWAHRPINWAVGRLPPFVWLLFGAVLVFQAAATSQPTDEGASGGAVMGIALILWLTAPHMEPQKDWRTSLHWRVFRSTGSHAICMGLFVVGFLWMLRGQPGVPPATRLGLIVTLSTATVAFAIRAKVRAHKICTATARLAEQLADDCHTLAAGDQPDLDRMRQQIRDLDRYLDAPLPTTFRIFGISLLPAGARAELVHGLLLGPLDHPHRPPQRWTEAAENLDRLAGSLARWTDPVV